MVVVHYIVIDIPKGSREVAQVIVISTTTNHYDIIVGELTN